MEDSNLLFFILFIIAMNIYSFVFFWSKRNELGFNGIAVMAINLGFVFILCFGLLIQDSSVSIFWVES